MSPITAAPPGRIRLAVADAAELKFRYGAELQLRSLFVRHDRPAAVGTSLLLEFGSPDTSAAPLASVTAIVEHARTATSSGDATAGMQLQLVSLDAVATAAAATAVAAIGITETPVRRIGLNLSDSGGPAILSNSGPIVGIDLGTVNTCVAVVENGQPRMLAGLEGYETLPSVVHVAADRQMVVGHRALEKMVLESDRTIYGSKRFIGRPFASKEVQSLGHFFPYRLVAGSRGTTAVEIDGATVALEEIAAAILRAAQLMASQALGREVVRAIITVPAYFGETQRQAVREAGKMAGLFVERIINEPSAAAVAYGYGRGLKRTILVYDLGVGTFDVSILRIDGDSLEVLATDGDPFLGGSDFDDRLTEFALMSYERQHPGSPVRQDRVAVQRLRLAVQAAKHQLSEAESVALDVPYIHSGATDAAGLHQTLERRILEALTQDLVDRTLGLVDAVLAKASLRSEAIDEFVLVGGQSRSPHVRRALTERFNRRPSSAVHPDHAVALGAAIVADTIHRRLPLKLTDILPASIRLGLAQDRAAILLPRGMKLPASQTFEVQPPTGVNQFKLVLCRGEAETLSQNTFLGTLQLTAGSGAKIQLQVQVDAEGLLAISAQGADGGPAQALEVSLTSS